MFSPSPFILLFYINDNILYKYIFHFFFSLATRMGRDFILCNVVFSVCKVVPGTW